MTLGHHYTLGQHMVMQGAPHLFTIPVSPTGLVVNISTLARQERKGNGWGSASMLAASPLARRAESTVRERHAFQGL